MSHLKRSLSLRRGWLPASARQRPEVLPTARAVEPRREDGQNLDQILGELPLTGNIRSRIEHHDLDAEYPADLEQQLSQSAAAGPSSR